MSAPVGNTSLTRFDVLVIGSGAGGSALTQVLCANGLKVLVLEAGPNRFLHLDDPSQPPQPLFANDELKLVARSFINPHASVEPRTFRRSPAEGKRSFVGDVNPLPKTVGGGAVHADLKAPRFTPTDFQLGTLLGDVRGASFADWPVQYDQLEPFYEFTERRWGVQGLAGANPFEAPRSTPFPMHPGAPMYLALKVSQGVEKLGYTPFPYPAAVNSVPYDGRPACIDCGFCSGYGCVNNSKGAPPVTTLRRALLSRNCLLLPETRAVKVLVNGAGDTVVGVEAIGPEGARQTYTADRYVLAASPIEDARLLLLSRPGGLGNSSDQVGRNLMFHLQTIAIGIFEERLHGHRGRCVSHGFADFRGKPGDANHPLGGIVEIGSSIMPIEEGAELVRFLGPLGFNGTDYLRLMRQSPLRDHLAALTLQAEDAPQPTNRVDLDPEVVDLDRLPVARVTYDHHAFELHARDFYGPKLVEIMGAAGARYSAVAPIDEPSESAHVMGTLRMGTDPRTSVCDATGKLHDLGNLYAADGSLFPTSAGWNPTLTIGALATYVAGCMVNPSSPEKALDPA